jgi:hypothetical protein
VSSYPTLRPVPRSMSNIAYRRIQQTKIGWIERQHFKSGFLHWVRSISLAAGDSEQDWDDNKAGISDDVREVFTGCLPDGWWVSEDGKDFCILEIEDTNMLTTEKLARYVRAHFELEFVDPSNRIRLFLADRYGNMKELDLSEFDFLADFDRFAPARMGVWCDVPHPEGGIYEKPQTHNQWKAYQPKAIAKTASEENDE